EEPVLDKRFDIEMACEDDRGILGFIDLHIPAAFDVKDAPIGSDGQLEGIGWGGIENDFLVIGIDGGTRVGGLDAGGEQDSAEQMRLEEGFGIALRSMPSSRVPGAAAIVIVRPGDRMIKTVGPAAVSRLIQGGQNMHGRAGIDRKIVPL